MGKLQKAKSNSNFVAAMSNFSIQYNLSCASIALAFMATHNDDVIMTNATMPPTASTSNNMSTFYDLNSSPFVADFPVPGWVNYVLLGVVFAGAVVGMSVMGYLADYWGRRPALLFTLGLTFVGAFGSAVLDWGSSGTIYALLAGYRFLLGVGVGGTYPCSAVSAAESSPGTSTTEVSNRVGWAFFLANAWSYGAVSCGITPLLSTAHGWDH